MPLEDGYVVTDATKTLFRTWDDGPAWSEDLDAALWFSRQGDAELFCADDEDAWCIILASVLRREAGLKELQRLGQEADRA